MATRVLIIDANAFFRAGVREALLKQSGPLIGSESLDIVEHEPGQAGEEAIRYVATTSPAVVLLDLTYPFLTGLELCRKICRSSRLVPAGGE